MSKFTPVKLNEDLENFLKDYYNVVEEATNLRPRDPKIWRWMYEASKILTFNTVPKDRREELYNLHVIGVILCIIIDDIADLVSQKNLVNLALEVMVSGKENAIPREFKNYKPLLLLAHKIRNYLYQKYQSCPQYPILKGDLHSALDEYWETLRATSQINYLLKSDSGSDFSIIFEEYLNLMKPGAYSYQHGMISLLEAKEIVEEELPLIRSLFRKAETSVVIGNWLATWKEEVPDRDFTSGVVVWALDYEVLTMEDLRVKEASWILDRISHSYCVESLNQRVENTLMDMEIHYKNLKTFDAFEYIQSIRKIYSLQMNHSEILKFASKA